MSIQSDSYIAICTMLGTITPPDLTNDDTVINGSHHTLAFYRKSLQAFWSKNDWDPATRTGNPTRTKVWARKVENVSPTLSHHFISRRSFGPSSIVSRKCKTKPPRERSDHRQQPQQFHEQRGRINHQHSMRLEIPWCPPPP